MAGTRGAPTVDGTPAYIYVSLHWIDSAGDKRSDSYQCDAGASAAEIEAFAAAMAATSNASLWKVGVENVYADVPHASFAASVARRSADDVINILLKTAANVAQDIVIRAPLQSMFIGETEEIDLTDGLLATAQSTGATILDGSYSSVSMRFTEHREIGKKQAL